MKHAHRASAFLAATVLAALPTAAWADVPCPETESARSPDSPPMPTIASYTVTRSTAPEGERTSGSHQATVIGGDAVEGEIRIDLTLSQDLPRNCPLIVAIVDPAASASEQDRGGGDVARALRLTETDRVQTMALNNPNLPVHRLSLRGDGTSRLLIRAKTRGQFGDHTAQLGLQIRGADTIYPFTLIRQGLPDFTPTLSTATTRFGSTIDVFAALPFTPGTGAIDENVTYEIKPGKAGNFRRPNQLRDLQSTLVDPLDADLTPRRSMVIFVPAAVERLTSATITATLMGRTKSMPITILPVPKPCKPEAEWTVAKGAVELTLTNSGEIPCTELVVAIAAAPLAVSDASKVSTVLYAMPDAPAPEPRGLAPVGRSFAPATPAPSASQPTSWTGRYAIPGPYPASFTVTATARPVNGSFPTITLPPFAVSAISIGKGR